MDIQERLTALRCKMKEKNIDIYVVPTSDFHESEYVGEHFKAREFITGFTGSAGTAVITQTEAGLWTDARYFVQAAAQLEGSTITLYRMREEDVPTVEEYMEKTMEDGQTIGFDGRVINGKLGDEIRELAEKKNGRLYVEEDLIDQIWENRPPLSCEKAWVFDPKYTGKTTEDKLKELREAMKEKGADVHLLTSLYDISWLLNVRGNDIEYVPVVLSYLAITEKDCIWFVQEQALTPEVRAHLDQCRVTVRDYEDFYSYAKSLKSTDTILINREVVNYRLCCCLPKEAKVLDEADPTEMMKAVKTPTEQENVRKAHEKDAVAMIRFMYWLKKNIGKIPMTEILASDYLEELRKEQEGFIELSFETISGYAEHGAVVHYAATPETDIPLKPEGLLLVDSGGHYLEGTTDITRTFVLGPITQEMKENFTRVCRSNINLAAARFLYGCSGTNLDVIARAPFWEVGLDFKHGTGHGVGYVLNVHEGPNVFRWQSYTSHSDEFVFEEGMVTTDEPGIYLEGKYGIRLENELLCRKAEKNEFGQFMEFENLTYVPMDLDGIDPTLMSSAERSALNRYHAMVYEKMSPYFEGDELAFLKEYTREI